VSSFFKNDLVKIALYFAGTVFVGALLAPGLFFAGKSVAATGALHESGIEWVRAFGTRLEETNFQRYFNRAVLLGALLCLIPLVKWLKIERGALGLEKNPSWLRHFSGGFALAAGLLLTMGWVYVLRGLPEDRDSLIVILRIAIVSSLSVPFLDEFLFRGMILGICVRAAGRTSALVFVTALFAAVHFMKPPDQLKILDPDVQWTSGFVIVGQCFGRFTDPISMAAEFATLFMVGWVLAVARLRTNSLWVSIGLHAGWVFGLKAFSKLTRRSATLDDTLPWVGADLKTGVVALLVVGLTGWLIHLWLRESHPAQLG
jgi:membrane protease YdiL (CAAX protease family)